MSEAAMERGGNEGRTTAAGPGDGRARLAARALALLGWLVFAFAVMVAGARGSELADRTRGFAESLPLSVAGAEVAVTIGEPDPRLELAPCRRYEPFVPSGARLWGKTSLGVRCVEGAAWTVYLPAQIKVFAEAPVAARPIARGQVLTADDERQERVEITLYPVGALAGADPIEGQVATRPIAAGEPLRRDLVRARPVFQRGDSVQVVAGGRGFAIVTEGKAMANGTEGQPVQVSVGSGRVLTGVARANGVVEVR